VYRHVVPIEPRAVFASGAVAPEDSATQYAPAVNDLRLASGGAAVDAGLALPNVNDGCAGTAPDLGAYEVGRSLPHYGPRSAK